MENMLRDIAAALVDDPNQIRITEKSGADGSLILELTVAKDDMGKIIGKRGRIVKSIRSLIKAAANKSGQKVNVEII